MVKRIKYVALAHIHLLFSLVFSTVGYAVLDAVGIVEQGRDPVPLMALGAMAIFFSGFTVRYRLGLTIWEQIGVLLPWLFFAYMLVAFGAGTMTPDALVMSWFSVTASILLLFWGMGALLGRWAWRKGKVVDR